ncbi:MULTISPECIES: undecaprenyl-diphosphate phosphatase [Bacillales]|jgi:undecaprenyl-diphosphatase|uniref:Undecaprenyl-diphosphatase n=1 Tax=Cytobacillus firmus TaxID=1399 RepID=A0A0J5VGF2_CYTFI|nr:MULTISPECIES: undecaprenyl-diphosphate phosphatase [Bacillales]KML36129.1 UDP pyrophosphate phosphatase [Cytobacillus firmus]MCC3646322.1 undecaprenyl-diphosphate phosphatase [Cytobacillus oceanisediminis]MCS0652914.1 undecaprenyl-diphosphate phosphatase [Cytobacillus firmus]MCU1803786.1 undecaprenyl-diphosphate phosphatase [Cytobacillus firmus]NUH84296.1 undecaprenyl-diphosphate phosphatase [Cytobacillus firmus]
MDFIMILKAIILGFVEGMTEFAPVSSTGHMIIVDDMWLNTKEFLSKYEANTFKVVIQLGSILAVVIIFRDRFIEMLGLGGRGKSSEEKQSRLKLSQVIVGLIPAGILGVLFEDYIDEHLFSTETVLIGLVIGAFLMIFADIFGGKNPKTVSVDQITYKQALSIGLIQCFSLWPGFSRSGSTISGGVLLGLSHRAAADFTFIMAVPIMAGASFLSLIKNLEYFSVEALPFFIAGFISAFIFALVSIRFFLKIIGKIKLIPFAIYRIVLAGVIYFVFL